MVAGNCLCREECVCKGNETPSEEGLVGHRALWGIPRRMQGSICSMKMGIWWGIKQVWGQQPPSSLGRGGQISFSFKSSTAERERSMSQGPLGTGEQQS